MVSSLSTWSYGTSPTSGTTARTASSPGWGGPAPRQRKRLAGGGHLIVGIGTPAWRRWPHPGGPGGERGLAFLSQAYSLTRENPTPRGATSLGRLGFRFGRFRR